jgi:alginate O-acetyltransferase complex protein AlgI
MSFVQSEFIAFMVVVFTLYWVFPHRRWQNLLLLVSSAIFYGWVHPWFLILLFSASTMDYLVGRGIERYPGRKKLLLVVSIVGNLGMLGYFKYFNFFVSNLASALGSLGIHTSMHTLGIFLPVGISFYTFQTMSYVIDVYRGQTRARKDFLDYQTFVCFFPQLVAGPIERAGHLLAQVEKDRAFSWNNVASGLTLAMWGAFKKICIADTISPYVDKVFILSSPSGPIIWAAALGFTIQILADFSGYTDIARGVARMLGFQVCLNFDHPYLARNPAQFWRRWHISFSSWIRDYLYIPLGGSRGGRFTTLKATYGALLLSGFWHGAAWNYVLWGFYHATLSLLYREIGPLFPEKLRKAAPIRALQVVLFFSLTVVGWLLFREKNISRLLHDFTLNPFVADPDQWVATTVLLAMCALCATPLVLGLVVERVVIPKLRALPWALPAQTTFWAIEAVAIFLFSRMSVNDFIYFQF